MPTGDTKAQTSGIFPARAGLAENVPTDERMRHSDADVNVQRERRGGTASIDDGLHNRRQRQDREGQMPTATRQHVSRPGAVRSPAVLSRPTTRLLTRPLLPMVCAGLAAISAAFAAPPPGDVSQLQQLNRSSDASLDYLQRPTGAPSSSIPQKPDAQRRLDSRQRAQQHWLQERQRRELLMLNQRARINPNPALPYRLQGIDMQRRFQLQQQNQLNRFRLQHGSPLR